MLLLLLLCRYRRDEVRGRRRWGRGPSSVLFYLVVGLRLIIWVTMSRIGRGRLVVFHDNDLDSGA